MIPPRSFPPGILKLVQEYSDGTKETVIELSTSSKNRDRINRMRNDLLMVDSTKNLYIIENNSK
jgi:hypothetical protein